MITIIIIGIATILFLITKKKDLEEAETLFFLSLLIALVVAVVEIPVLAIVFCNMYNQ